MFVLPNNLVEWSLFLRWRWPWYTRTNKETKSMEMPCYGVISISQIKRVQSELWMRWEACMCLCRKYGKLLLFLPFPPFETSSWALEVSVFFFFVTEVPFLSKVIGLYCGRLLNFLSNSSSNLPRLKAKFKDSLNRILEKHNVSSDLTKDSTLKFQFWLHPHWICPITLLLI